ncbi:hypothetical protein BBH99_08260 [Chryseobacterium contaminans]|uniref:Uncharacterized protein n=1 Tax=Chryseobacterium contaminans TaxID=1423959 RepID=A0A1M7HID5_9FLAO|nr:hypothetical protein [Chryseobacterium contaminans]OCA78509.1 hypothetical protein BBH99_08260 [Chryseobacterium contaminans]SHM28252.1 hypothetical protein SAMN05444407_11233 [Chryseobacterium contaminans]
MKNIFLYILLLSGVVISCGSDDDSLQRIDQILNIYMKSDTNPDLLNAKKSGSFTSFSVNDMLGDKENSPVTTMPLRMRQDSVFYIEYIGGAQRKKFDSAGTTYYSRMALTLNRTVNNAPQPVVTDILEIRYRNTPEVFQVSEVLYNNKSVFTKGAGTPNSINNVTITK